MEKKKDQLWWDLCSMKVRGTLFSKVSDEKWFKIVISVLEHSVHMTFQDFQVSRILKLFLKSTYLVKYSWSVSLLVEPLWPSFWQEASESGWVSLFPNTSPILSVFYVRECSCSHGQWDSPTEWSFSHQSQWVKHFPCNWDLSFMLDVRSGHEQNQAVLSNREETKTCWDCSLRSWMFLLKTLRLVTVSKF